jgi:MerR family redox-sensitive transcriptional activator SoxR
MLEAQVNLRSSTKKSLPLAPRESWTITIGQVVKRSGVAASALRFYEEKGLIASFRTGSGHRRYGRAVLRRIAFIVFAQRLGLSLEEIKVELDKLGAKGVPSNDAWARISRSWNARIDERIAELQRLRDQLTECIGCGCLSLERCHLSNPQDRMGVNGPGPRFWLGDRRRRGSH